MNSPELSLRAIRIKKCWGSYFIFYLCSRFGDTTTFSYRIKGNPVRIRSSARYCKAQSEGKHSYTTVRNKDGKVAFRASQETCQAYS